MASTLVAMASNPVAMASTLILLLTFVHPFHFDSKLDSLHQMLGPADNARPQWKSLHEPGSQAKVCPFTKEKIHLINVPSQSATTQLVRLNPCLYSDSNLPSENYMICTKLLLSLEASKRLFPVFQTATSP